eukprot:403362236
MESFNQLYQEQVFSSIQDQDSHSNPEVNFANEQCLQETINVLQLLEPQDQCQTLKSQQNVVPKIGSISSNVQRQSSKISKEKLSQISHICNKIVFNFYKNLKEHCQNIHYRLHLKRSFAFSISDEESKSLEIQFYLKDIFELIDNVDMNLDQAYQNALKAHELTAHEKVRQDQCDKVYEKLLRESIHKHDSIYLFKSQIYKKAADFFTDDLCNAVPPLKQLKVTFEVYHHCEMLRAKFQYLIPKETEEICNLICKQGRAPNSFEIQMLDLAQHFQIQLKFESLRDQSMALKAPKKSCPKNEKNHSSQSKNATLKNSQPSSKDPSVYFDDSIYDFYETENSTPNRSNKFSHERQKHRQSQLPKVYRKKSKQGRSSSKNAKSFVNSSTDQ